MELFAQSLRTSQKLGHILAVFLSIVLILAGMLKVIGLPMFQELFTSRNIGEFLQLIGLGLTLSSILYAIPRTKMIGTLLLSAYFGGAIVFHMTGDEPFILQSVILISVWLFTWLREPTLIIPKKMSSK